MVLLHGFIDGLGENKHSTNNSFLLIEQMQWWSAGQGDDGDGRGGGGGGGGGVHYTATTLTPGDRSA